MKYNKKKRKMWLILFYLSFVIVIILQQKLQKTGLELGEDCSWPLSSFLPS